MFHLFTPLLLLSVASAGDIPYETLLITSTFDQTEQPARFYASPNSGPQPLLVQLHTWSTDVNTHNPDDWVAIAQERGWHVVMPHFRGANKNPEACASPAARQDILDATRATIAKFEVDPSRVYLAGVSGGGHMAMVMAAHSPTRWTAVTAWVGISDLAAWHGETQRAGHGYWRDVEACVGGAPGSSAAVDEQIRLRSPLYFMSDARGVPLDINAGIHDGHSGSVPIHHSIDAFNVLAESMGAPVVSQSRINALSQVCFPAVSPVEDADYERRIHLRESAGSARVTIFEGGHEGLPASACRWLALQQRDTE